MGNISSNNKNNLELSTRKIKKYGWVLDIPDSRDILASIPKIDSPLSKIDLRDTNFLPNIHNQGDLGSCTSHTVLYAYLYDLARNGKKLSFTPSRSFLYYNQRLLNGTENFDSGSSIRDAIKIISKIGVCSEDTYPYDTTFFTDKPLPENYKESSGNITKFMYKRVEQNINDIIKILNFSVPIMFGMALYESFEYPDVARTGMVPMPLNGEQIIGGTTALIVGYDMQRKLLICMGNHGTKWGGMGYFWVSFSYINSRYCSDFWVMYTGTIKQVLEKVQVPEQVKVQSPVKTQEIPNITHEIVKSPVKNGELDITGEKMEELILPPSDIQPFTSQIFPNKEAISNTYQNIRPSKRNIITQPKIINKEIKKYTSEYINNIDNTDIIDDYDSDTVNYAYKSDSDD
jgi:C1A family cysteine protease